jgi:uncharacterized RDD family membrane protein YckC
MAAPDENALPPTQVDSALEPTGLKAPALVPRMGSWLYEGLLLFGVVFISGYLFGTLTQTRHAMDNRLALQAFLFCVVGTYFVWFWSRGQTLAMKTWRIRVVDVQGKALTQKRALLRYLLVWVWCVPPLVAAHANSLDVAGTSGVFFLWVAAWAALSHLHPLKQFWHDELAGTRLVDYRPAG